MADESVMAECSAARREFGSAMVGCDPDLIPLHSGDVTVPVSRYPAIVRRARELAVEAGLLVPPFCLGKRDFLAREHGEASVDAMYVIERARGEVSDADVEPRVSGSVRAVRAGLLARRRIVP